jgi:hypothetical protein
MPVFNFVEVINGYEAHRESFLAKGWTEAQAAVSRYYPKNVHIVWEPRGKNFQGGYFLINGNSGQVAYNVSLELKK